MIAALGTFPIAVFVYFNFAIVTAFRAVIGFRIKFRVGNVIVNILHHGENGVDVLIHIGNFHVADAAAGGNFLEFTFEREFVEDINIFSNIHVVAVGVVAFIRNVFDFAESSFVDGSEAIGQRFRRRAVKGEAQTRFFLPAIHSVAQRVHKRGLLQMCEICR